MSGENKEDFNERVLGYVRRIQDQCRQISEYAGRIGEAPPALTSIEQADLIILLGSIEQDVLEDTLGTLMGLSELPSGTVELETLQDAGQGAAGEL